jgi:hypothetical protein
MKYRRLFRNLADILAKEIQRRETNFKLVLLPSLTTTERNLGKKGQGGESAPVMNLPKKTDKCNDSFYFIHKTLWTKLTFKLHERIRNNPKYWIKNRKGKPIINNSSVRCWIACFCIILLSNPYPLSTTTTTDD